MSIQKIIKLIKQGNSLREISKKLNVSYRLAQKTGFNIKIEKKGLKDILN